MSTGSLTKKENDTTQYAKMFSSFFCSVSILALSALCLLNSLTLDMYAAVNLLKVVTPAAFCFWTIGFMIGKILDTNQSNLIRKKKLTEQQAYEIPSMFSGMDSNNTEDEFGDL